MKTNQVLTRKMGEFDVMQRTSDGYFNATHLLNQWNNKNPKEKRELDNFWKSTNLDKLMSEIALNELNINTVDFTVLKKALSKTSVGKNGGTSMHPILFIKFSMYLSPRFEYHVLKFVYDQLIEYRNEAGDAYRLMSGAVASISEKDLAAVRIQSIARAINHIVFGAHEREARNKQADEPKMKELFELERKITSLISEGFITSYDQLIGYLRKMWSNKWQPKELTA